MLRHILDLMFFKRTTISFKLYLFLKTAFLKCSHRLSHSPCPVHTCSLKILFFQRIAIFFRMPPVGPKFMHAFFAIKGLSPVNDDEYVIHCLDVWPKTFLLNRNLGKSFAINDKEGIIDRRIRIYPRQLIARNPVNQVMNIKHQNLEETIIYLVHLLLDY